MVRIDEMFDGGLVRGTTTGPHSNGNKSDKPHMNVFPESKLWAKHESNVSLLRFLTTIEIFLSKSRQKGKEIAGKILPVEVTPV